MPSFIDVLLETPEVGAQLKQLEAAVGGYLGHMAEMFRPHRELVNAAVQRVAESPPSNGYEPMLTERGLDPILARMTARLLVRRGRRIAEESKWSRDVVNAIRFLAKPRRRSAFVRKAQFLLETWQETSSAESLACGAGVNDLEFHAMLKSAVEADQGACRRVAEIALSITQRLSVLRGPKISAASAAHEFLLDDLRKMTGLGSYTYSDAEEDFVDPLTRATRLEFEEPDFDPRPARRRIKKRAKGK